MRRVFFTLLAGYAILTARWVQAQPQFGQLEPEAAKAQAQSSTLSPLLTSYQAYLIADGEVKTQHEAQLTTSNPDESVVLARNQGHIVLHNITLFKEGIATNREQSSFQGVNAALLCDESQIEVANGSITTSGEGANAVVALGPRALITLEHTAIKTTEDGSGGLLSTYGGTLRAYDLVVETEGSGSSALSTTQGEGMVELKHGALTSYGLNSPLLRSTGLIKLTEVRGIAHGSEMAVIDGKNAIVLEACELNSRAEHGVMLYQSYPEAANAQGQAFFSAKDTRLTNLSDGYMFYITNTHAQLYLERTTLKHASDRLLRASASLWGHEGRNGGALTLNTREQELRGEISADALSELTINLGERSRFAGSINAAHTARSVMVNLAADALWELTAHSCLTCFIDADQSFSNLRSNGFNLTYKSSQCPQLGGQSFALPGGGKLEPEIED